MARRLLVSSALTAALTGFAVPIPALARTQATPPDAVTPAPTPPPSPVETDPAPPATMNLSTPAPPPPASPPSGPSAPLGRIDLTTTAPAPPVQRSYHVHDGFYARASVGFGSLSASFDDGAPGNDDLTGSGTTMGFDLLLGGSPSPGIAIGGGLLAQGAFSTELERDGYSEDRSISVVTLGPFIDGFPDSNRGWHFGGLLGVSAVSVEDSSADGVSETMGFGGAAFFGYDFWVAEEWSVGPLLRFSGTLTRDDDGNVDAATFSTVLSFTALYH